MGQWESQDVNCYLSQLLKFHLHTDHLGRGLIKMQILVVQVWQVAKILHVP